MGSEIKESPESVSAMVGVDLKFSQEYEESDFAFLSKSLMDTLNIKEGDYILVEKEGFVKLRAIPYRKSDMIVIPKWAREKIKTKVKDYVTIKKVIE